MDTQLHNAIVHLHRLLQERGIKGDVTLTLSDRGEAEALSKMLSVEAKPAVPLMDLKAFLAQSEVIGL